MYRRIISVFITIGAICCILSDVIAQDTQYSQFYAAPLYLNPALTGASELTRVGVNYRNQWPGLDYSFNSYSAYIDHYIFDYNSGVGLIFNGSQESLANLSTNEIGLSYAYRLQLSENNFFRIGGMVSFMQRDALFSDLVFGSQIDIINGTIGGITDELNGIPIDSRYSFFDYSVGGMFYSKKIWLGVSAHHLSEPNTSFVEDQISKLPMKLSAQGGIKFDLGGGPRNYFTHAYAERSVSFAFNYKQQDPFNQLDVGAQFYLEPLVLGIWYRGIPTKNNLPSGGAHEISLTYSFLWGNAKSRNQRSRVIPCFKY